MHATGFCYRRLTTNAISLSALVFLSSCGFLNFGSVKEKYGISSNEQSNAMLTTASGIKLLSNQEYVWSVSDLVGKTYDLSLVSAWGGNAQYSGFDALVWTNLDSKAVNDRLNTAESVASDAVASAQVMTCTVSNSAEKAWSGCPSRIATAFVGKAFRRPATSEELSNFRSQYEAAIARSQKNGAGDADQFRDGMREVFATTLMSPQFFTRTLPMLSPGEYTRKLTGYEVAERLSYLIAGTLPDDELLAAAKSDAILQPKEILAQSRRLFDKYHDRFVAHFFGQFMGYKKLLLGTPSDLHRDFVRESNLVFSELFKNDRPLEDYLTPGFTYVNNRLASHYGISGGFDGNFTRVETPIRGGMLTQGSFLAMTGVPILSNHPPMGQPIKRGIWVQARLLCNPIQPTPSDLLQEIGTIAGNISTDLPLHERLAVHRSNSARCENCHRYMDPVGLGLESFGPEGQSRSFYDAGQTKPVVDRGELLGKNFEGPTAMSGLLAELPEFKHCVGERIMNYTLGQPTSARTNAFVNALIKNKNGKSPSFKDLILRVVTSQSFQTLTREK